MQAKRLIALDSFRGLTLALMILVNTPGSWSYVYPPLQHALWHGVTPTDFIFPFFLFIVGASISFSLKQHIQQQTIPWQKLGKRTLLLFLIGLGLNWFPFETDLEQLRIMGVLQRIALCYFLACLLILLLPLSYLSLCALLLLLAYWSLLLSVEQGLSPEYNLVRYLDLKLLGEAHMWQGTKPVFEPEGILSTIPAVVTVISGYFAGYLFQQKKVIDHILRTLLLLSIIAFIVGLVWAKFLPLNKQLWTGSFVFITSAGAYFFLACLLMLEKYRINSPVLKVTQIYGSNPLLIYILSWLWAVLLSQCLFVEVNGQQVSVYDWSFEQLKLFMSPQMASLSFALLNVALFYLLSHLLYKNKVFVRL